MILAVIGGFALAAVAVRPMTVRAAGISGGAWPAAVLPARSSEHQRVIDALAAVIGSSAEVLAVHQRGPRAAHGGGSPFVEIVLRLHDPHGSEFISDDEIAVISHSEVMETIMFFAIRGRGRSDDMTSPLSSRRHAPPDHGSPRLFSREYVAGLEFCERWRRDAAVASSILATGVTDFRAEVRPRSGGRAGEASRLGLHLTWSPPGADETPDEAAVIIEVRENR